MRLFENKLVTHTQEKTIQNKSMKRFTKYAITKIHM